MKTSILVIATVLLAVSALGQNPEHKGANDDLKKTRIALVNSNIPSGTIFKEAHTYCQGVLITLDASKADYVLEAQLNREQENKTERSWLTLFDKQGDAVFATDTRGTGNAVKDVCAFLKVSK